MSTPTLSPGTFFLFSYETSRYIAGKSGASSGDAVATDNTNNNARFSVTLSDGQYTFFSNITNMYLSPGTDQRTGDPILIWRATAYKWDVPSSGAGLWDVNNTGADAYWMDTKDSADHVVVLTSKAQQGKRIQWQLIAA